MTYCNCSLSESYHSSYTQSGKSLSSAVPFIIISFTYNLYISNVTDAILNISMSISDRQLLK